MTISKQLMGILVCPLCKQQVVQTESGDCLECSVCQLQFPIRNDIPVMLVEEAKKIVTDVVTR